MRKSARKKERAERGKGVGGDLRISTRHVSMASTMADCDTSRQRSTREQTQEHRRADTQGLARAGCSSSANGRLGHARNRCASTASFATFEEQPPVFCPWRE